MSYKGKGGDLVEDVIRDLTQHYILLKLLMSRLQALGIQQHIVLRYDALDKAVRLIELAADDVKSAAHQISFYLSGPAATEYRDVFILDRWRQFLERYGLSVIQDVVANASGTVSALDAQFSEKAMGPGEWPPRKDWPHMPPCNCESCKEIRLGRE